MHPLSSAFVDSSIEARFGAQCFEDACGLHVSLLGLGAFASFLIAKNGLLITSAADTSQGNLSTAVPPGSPPVRPSGGELSGGVSTWTVVTIAEATMVAMAATICLRLLAPTAFDPAKAQRVSARGWTALVLLGLAIIAATSDPDPTDSTVAVKAQASSSPPISAASPPISAASPLILGVSPLELLELTCLGLASPLTGFLVATINGTLGMRFWHTASLIGLMQSAALLWVWRCANGLAARVALSSLMASLALGWAVSHLHERMHRSSFLRQHDLGLRDDATRAALHEIEAEMEREMQRLVVLRHAADRDQVIRRLQEELSRSREELSRAAVRVREATTRREAAERSARVHTRIWLSQQYQMHESLSQRNPSQSPNQSPSQSPSQGAGARPVASSGRSVPSSESLVREEHRT